MKRAFAWFVLHGSTLLAVGVMLLILLGMIGVFAYSLWIDPLGVLLVLSISAVFLFTVFSLAILSRRLGVFLDYHLGRLVSWARRTMGDE